MTLLLFFASYFVLPVAPLPRSLYSAEVGRDTVPFVPLLETWVVKRPALSNSSIENSTHV